MSEPIRYITKAEEEGFLQLGWGAAIHRDKNGAKYIVIKNGEVVR